MKALQKLVTVIALPMVFILPFWLTFGRGSLGAGGWGTLILLLFWAAPIVFVMLLFFYFMIRFRPDVMNARLFGRIDSVLLIILYVSIFFYGLFFVDAGDTTQSVNSAAQILGLVNIDTSNAISPVFFVISIFTALSLAVVVIAERIKKEEFWIARNLSQKFR